MSWITLVHKSNENLRFEFLNPVFGHLTGVWVRHQMTANTWLLCVSTLCSLIVGALGLFLTTKLGIHQVDVPVREALSEKCVLIKNILQFLPFAIVFRIYFFLFWKPWKFYDRNS